MTVCRLTSRHAQQAWGFSYLLDPGPAEGREDPGLAGDASRLGWGTSDWPGFLVCGGVGPR